MALTATVLENWGAPTQPPAPIGATSADLAARFIAAGLARGVDGHVLPSDDGTVPFGCTGTEFHAAGTESPFPNGVVFRCPAKVDAMMLTANYASLSEIAPSWVFRSPDGLTVLRLDGTLPTEQALQFEAEVHPGAAAEPEAAAPWGGTPAALAARFVAAGLARKAHGGAVATADEADGLPLGCAGTVLELVDPVEDGLVVQCSKKTDADMLATRFAAESEQPRHGAWWVFRSSDGLIVLLLDGALPEERARKFGAEIQ